MRKVRTFQLRSSPVSQFQFQISNFQSIFLFISPSGALS